MSPTFSRSQGIQMPSEPPRRSARATEEIRQLENQQLDQKSVMRGRRILPAPIVQEKWLISAPFPAPSAMADSCHTMADLCHIRVEGEAPAEPLPGKAFRSRGESCDLRLRPRTNEVRLVHGNQIHPLGRGRRLLGCRHSPLSAAIQYVENDLSERTNKQGLRTQLTERAES